MLVWSSLQNRRNWPALRWSPWQIPHTRLTHTAPYSSQKWWLRSHWPLGNVLPPPYHWYREAQCQKVPCDTASYPCMQSIVLLYHIHEYWLTSASPPRWCSDMFWLYPMQPHHPLPQLFEAYSWLLSWPIYSGWIELRSCLRSTSNLWHKLHILFSWCLSLLT